MDEVARRCQPVSMQERAKPVDSRVPNSFISSYEVCDPLRTIQHMTTFLRIAHLLVLNMMACATWNLLAKSPVGPRICSFDQLAHIRSIRHSRAMSYCNGVKISHGPNLYLPQP